MAIENKLDESRIHICVSSSIENFHEKLKRFGNEWKWWKPLKKVVFFGMYHIGDHWKLLFHRGKRIIFWCGSDILTCPWWMKYVKAEHWCENEIEQRKLQEFDIKAKIYPMFFGNPTDFPVSFRSSKNPHVYICCHKGREEEYGIDFIEYLAQEIPEIIFHIYGIYKRQHDNIWYHGKVSEFQFNNEIKKYQSALRLNKFDGFGDIIAKSVLMGQYPITAIPYPHITHINSRIELLGKLRELLDKKKPNLEARNYWLNHFNNHPL